MDAGDRSNARPGTECSVATSEGVKGQVCRWRYAFYLLLSLLMLAPIANGWAFGTLAVSPNPASVGQEVTLAWPAESGACLVYQNGAYWANTSCSTGEYKFTPSNAGEYNYAILNSLYVSTNTISLMVEESGGSDPDPIPIVPEIISFTASPASIIVGQTSTLNWSVQDADSCIASGGWSGSKSASGGSQTLSGLAVGSYNYILVCQSAAGSSAPKTATLEVLPSSQVQITSFTISAGTILQGEAASLSWSVANAQSCTGSGDWSGSKNINGGTSSISST